MKRRPGWPARYPWVCFGACWALYLSSLYGIVSARTAAGTLVCVLMAVWWLAAAFYWWKREPQ